MHRPPARDEDRHAATAGRAARERDAFGTECHALPARLTSAGPRITDQRRWMRQALGMQCGDALGDEARLRGEDVAPLEQFDVPVAVVQAMHFVGVDREWRPLLFSRRIVQRHQQAATTGRQPRVQLVHVALAHRRWQRDQCGAIVDASAGATAPAHRARTRRRRGFRWPLRRRGVRRPFRRLSATGGSPTKNCSTAIGDSSTPSTRYPRGGQPQHVQRLAGKRNEHPAPAGTADRVPVLFEQWRHAVLVEADAAFAASAVARNQDPCVSFSTSVAACLRRASIRQAVRRLSAAPRPCALTSTLIVPPRAASYGGYSTESPSTFCQPRGNNPPRVARLPTYSPRSLNDSVIVRLPERTDSVPAGRHHGDGDDAFGAEFRLGISIILLPLPRSSSRKFGDRERQQVAGAGDGDDASSAPHRRSRPAARPSRRVSATASPCRPCCGR